ncbi:hypothetical protein FHP29_05545 [Nocardioides albidus]|uniref:VanZ-like domain-containing protein n=1 Tax=Nocardioides albidus TaxID=1517589 RepID=A0A5C4W7J3_9ACTN|nr:VanZ family protein [Nocardioides albidus]TNM44171.1 hypothetical protein FHP29_05545 [Nocardioides albidus]
MVLHVWELLIDVGVSPTLATPTRVEALVNAAMFVPPVALAVVALPRLRWLEVVGLGFITSLGVEVVQAILLDARTAQAVDLASNTTGALIGAAAGATFRRWEQLSARRSAASGWTTG